MVDFMESNMTFPMTHSIEWYERNKIHQAKYRNTHIRQIKKYRAEHKAEQKKWNATWRFKNAEKKRENDKLYRKKNLEHLKHLSKRWREKNKEKVKESKKQYWLLNRGRELLKCKARYAANRIKILAYWKKWRQTNKKEKAKRDKQYRVKNPEKCKQFHHNYYLSHKEKIIEYGRRWKIKNPELFKKREAAYRKKHKTQIRINALKYNNSVKGKIIAKKHANNRREMVKNAKFKLTFEKIKRAYKKTKGLCYYCKKPISETNFTLEHIKPLARAGTNHGNNLVACCRRCNCSKQHKTKKEFEYYLKMVS